MILCVEWNQFKPLWNKLRGLKFKFKDSETIYLSFSSLILTSCIFAEENSLNFCEKFQIEVSKCKPGVFSYIASGTVIGINESKSVKFFFSVYITMINYKVCVLLPSAFKPFQWLKGVCNILLRHIYNISYQFALFFVRVDPY